MKMKCPLCGDESLERKTGAFHFELPGKESGRENPEREMDFPDSEWDECGACGEVILSVELQKRIERRQYARKGILTPEEIKSIREKYSLTQARMAQILQVGEKNFSRWENGIAMQTKSMDSLIRQFEKRPEEFLKNEGGKQASDSVSSYLRTIESGKGGNVQALAAHGGIRGKKNRETLSRFIKDKL